MKREPKAPDPLGVRPSPISGDTQPRYLDVALRTASENALATCLQIWIPTDRQEIIVAQLLAFMNVWFLAEDKETVGGRRLSQHSQAGKTATMRALRRKLAQLRKAAGLPPCEREAVIVTLQERVSLKGLYQLILKAMGDPCWADKVSAPTLLQRIEEFSAKLGMRILVIDEIQHLDNETKDAKQVLNQLKVFVDGALFPVVFVGDEESEPFFERNPKLAARLGEPLQLLPLQPLSDDDDAVAFKTFCRNYDKALTRSNVLRTRAGLDRDELLDGLIIASGGHVGRVARLMQVAVEHAVWRDADTVEAFDLSHAVRTYARKNQWVRTDPFSARPAAGAVPVTSIEAGEQVCTSPGNILVGAE